MKRIAPEKIEEEYVNKVYDAIAPHFDHTRYKPWPGVKKFVENLSPLSHFIDVGCGNGRNLKINPMCYDMGTDMSMSLCKIAAETGRPMLCASAVELPIRSNFFDHAICIAVIHHFASFERRVQCMKEICRIIKPGGTAFVTAWATKQPRKQYEDPDQMIPWNVRKDFDENQPRYERFYHFFVQGEFQALIEHVPELELVSEVWEEGNWEVVVAKKV